MTATDFDYIATRNEIIESAFEIVGVKDKEQPLTAGQLDQGIKALQTLIKHWSNKHLFMWSFSQDSFSTVALQVSYTSTIDTTMIGLEKAWVVDSTDEIPIKVVSYSRYLDIINKTSSTGRPLVAAFTRTPSPIIYLWPEPDAIYTMKIAKILPLKDFDLAAGTGDLSAQFLKALTYGLAEDLYDRYPGPMNQMQFIQQKAAVLFQEAKNSDQPRETLNQVEGLYGRCR